MKLKIAESVAIKLLKRHHVSVFEVFDAMNDRRKYKTLIRKERHLDDEGRRAEERTYYIVARTMPGRYLRIIIIEKEGEAYLKTALPADDNDKATYRRRGK